MVGAEDPVFRTGEEGWSFPGEAQLWSQGWSTASGFSSSVRNPASVFQVGFVIGTKVGATGTVP